MSNDKRCRKCSGVKPIDEFHKRKDTVDGYAYICKPCAIASAQKWNAENSERKATYDADRWDSRKPRLTALHSAWVDANKEKVATYQREWRAKNNARSNQIAKACRDKNLPERLARNASRRAVAKQATPNWSIAFFVEEAYRLAKARTVATGFRWEVDHVVPLRSNLVCGLHAHTNVRVIPKAENMRKRNYFWPDSPQGEAS